MDESSGAPTVKVAVPETLPSVAVMVAFPATNAVATPLLLLAFDAWATVVSLDDHVTWAVRSAVAPPV